ncbi:EAL domain-containing protein [Shewanella inventionis]|uniref:D-glycero-D-manno-heptose 1-phosphate guanosyltransferase n=1 Tax=Shewanella inventionis TaxID=1738770 RepID=A0ABQ1IU94_9GAMM|nr:EAL domain-containing protein [Shewanella inventionis]MCL1158505.1 EAL domain-containing protein [Shewanella inventionis]UAL44380.1 EAL domain-containing protein [Shewanella inventionis]GGB52567.1 D-glycero-D-manno-heptose 1-phosphate guanosyltransferase [Shewanella inventionis]
MADSTQQLLKSVFTNGPIEGNNTSVLALLNRALEIVCNRLECSGAFILTSQFDNLFAPDSDIIDTTEQQCACHFAASSDVGERFNQAVSRHQKLCKSLLENTQAIGYCAEDDNQALFESAPLLVPLLQTFLSLDIDCQHLALSPVLQVGNVKVILGALCINDQQNTTDQRPPCDAVHTLLDDTAYELASALELRRLAVVLDNKDKQYQELFQLLPLACALIDLHNVVVLQNDIWQSILPIKPGDNLFDVLREEDHPLLNDTLHIVREGILRQAWCEVPLRNGAKNHWYKFSFCHALNRQQQLLLMIEDVTERYRLADELSFHSHFDVLTGLPNRVQFENMLDNLLNDEDHIPACIAFLDLDQFQVVNDLSGHQAGDQLLQQVAVRLKQLLRKGDIVARLGGDEFGLLMHYSDKSSAQQVAKRICQQLFGHEFVWKGIKHNVSASIGIAQVDYADGDIYGVMSKADAACQLAKEDGRNRWHFYNPDDPQMHIMYNQMLASVDIAGALALNQFELFYQLIEPLNKQESGIHMEILLRMVQSDGTYVSPGVFLPAAERYNLAPRVDSWVIDNLLKWGGENLAIWQQLSMVSVNLSAMSLADQKFMSWLEMRLMVEPELVDKLCFEITETAAVSQLEQATGLIDLLKPFGCKLALDDFGSGFSSFAYLKCLDVDYVKIDGQFVVNLCSNRNDKAIVSAICQLGKDMHFEVIAEFVENTDIGEYLRNIGVDYAQGYAINKPTRLTELDNGLRQPWLTDAVSVVSAEERKALGMTHR